ncbi:protein JTB-like isoform X2 [Panulirus ornatus]|uniref:protein JTB-like isoform X2 n=1 Tax=Panulirus ornatus TaxID=150431 RepID=UPI003A8A0B6D
MVCRVLTFPSMLTSFLGLLGITLVVLLLESYFMPEAEKPEELLSRVNPQDLCWTNEDYNLLDDCQLCSDTERTHIAPALCKLTGYRQKVQCQFSGEAYRSCEVLVLQEELRFWLFEGVAASVGVVAGLSTALRHQQLRSRGRLEPYHYTKISV